MDEIYLMYQNLKKQSEKNMFKEKWQFYCPIILKAEKLIEGIEKNSIEYINLIMVLGYANYEKSRLLIKINHLSSLENLEKSIEVLKKYKNHDNIVYIYLKIINLFSYLQSKNGNLDRAKNELIEAEKLYYALESKKHLKIFSFENVLKSNNNNKENIIKLEKLVTNNLQILSWVYNKQNQQELFVLYHHKVLERQLEFKNGSALLWLQKCARLSSYFLSKQQFPEARHHLAAAVYVLQKYENDLKTEPHFLEVDDLQQYFAEIARYWVKYAIFLFNTSHMKLKNNHLGMSRVDNNESEPQKKLSNKNMIEDKYLLFSLLDLSEIESLVTCELITTTNQARTLFTFAQTWLKKSKEYYTIQNHTLDYVNSILDLSELYRYLAYYESDIEAQYNVQKRRMDVLETLSSILKNVRPSCYVAVRIELLQALSEVQIELLALNVEKLWKTDITSEFSNLNMIEEYNDRKLKVHMDILEKLGMVINKLTRKKEL